MSGTSNFQQFNPNQQNQESDAQYTSDTMRASGAPTNSEFPSVLANKMFYQLTTFIAAFAAMLAAKGYSVSDTNMNTLAGVLSNVATNADLTNYQFGAPKANTPDPSDNSQRIATTAFAKMGLAIDQQVTGYLKLPSFLGGFIIQWGNGVANSTVNVPGGTVPGVTLNLPYGSFPNAVLGAFANSNSLGSYASVCVDRVQSSGTVDLSATNDGAVVGYIVFGF